MTNLGLPDYDSPPVVETILGVQFSPIGRLTTPLLGAFWSTIRDEWPNVSESAYLESKFEDSGSLQSWSQLRFQLREGHPPARLQMRNENRDRMLQVQNSRLHVNWMGYEGAEYPRYPIVRELFENEWNRFTRFVADEGLGQPAPNQCEVTYINHIPFGTVWQTPADWTFMKLLGDASVLEDLAAFEAFQGQWRFSLPDDSGRLHILWKPGKRRSREDPEQQEDILILEQTVRGPLSDAADVGGILEALDMAREVIVKSFTQLMDAKANEFWGYQPGRTSHE
jgi:uncharacterized protein (TIGR04255 family)